MSTNVLIVKSFVSNHFKFDRFSYKLLKVSTFYNACIKLLIAFKKPYRCIYNKIRKRNHEKNIIFPNCSFYYILFGRKWVKICNKL